MSEHLDIEAITARLAAGVNTTEALFENVMKSIRGVGIVLPFAQAHVIAASMNDLRHPYEADIAALLAEVARLRAERSEWCDRADRLLTEHMTQERDHAEEVARLRARLVVDDAMVERAERAWYDKVSLSDEVANALRIVLDAALLAAGMDEAQP